MSSYCEVCRGLFDFPHCHVKCSAAASTTMYSAGCSRRSSPQCVPRCRPSSSSLVSPTELRERSRSRRGTSTPTTGGAERETVSLMLRKSSSFHPSALVRTPTHCSSRRACGGRMSTGDSRRSGRSLSKESARQLSVARGGQGRAARRLDSLQKTLERLREAVRRDNPIDGTKATADTTTAPAPTSTGIVVPAAAFSLHDSEGFSVESWRLDNDNGNTNSSGQMNINRGSGSKADADNTLSRPVLGSSAREINDDVVNVDRRGGEAPSCGRGLSYATPRVSPLAPSYPREATETRAYTMEEAPIPKLLSSTSSSFTSTSSALLYRKSLHPGQEPPRPSNAPLQGITPSSVPHTSQSPKLRHFESGELPSGERQTSTLQTPMSPEAGFPYSNSSMSYGAGSQRDTVITNIEALRGGFVELCSAVREDLQALHVRVNEIQKQQQQQQQWQHRKQGLTMEAMPCRHAARNDNENDAMKVLSSSIQYEKLLADLQQHTVETIHKVLQQQKKQQQQQQQWQERHQEPKERYAVGSSGLDPIAPDTSPLSTHDSQPLKSQWGSLPMGEICGISPEAFDAHVRSAVRAILHEENFCQVAEDVLAQQEVQKKDIKATRREWKRHYAELEEQVSALADAMESTRIDVEELRLRPVPSSPVPPRTILHPAGNSASLLQPPFALSSHETDPLPANRKTTATDKGSEMLEERLIQRVQQLIADSEERWVQRAQGEIMQPVLEHVRRLMSAHQSMIDTVVESRCAQFEAYVDRGRHVWELQVSELRSRVSSLRSDMHRALKDLCENLNVACPGI